jgi:hypothetical protein
MEMDNLPGQMEKDLLDSIRMIRSMEKEFFITIMGVLKIKNTQMELNSEKKERLLLELKIF